MYQVQDGGQGTQNAALMYNDANANGAWDAGEDIFLADEPEPHSIGSDLKLRATGRFINDSESPCIGAGDTTCALLPDATVNYF